MPIIFDMANGSIRSDTAAAPGGREPLDTGAPSLQPRLAQIEVEARSTQPEHEPAPEGIHIINRLLRSDRA